jgi:DNA-directed RNA polymerase subunit RPC12/RpoP
MPEPIVHVSDRIVREVVECPNCLVEKGQRCLVPSLPPSLEVDWVHDARFDLMKKRYVTCPVCNGSGMVSTGPWGSRPPRVTCAECSGKAIVPSGRDD